jgi:hypothetical protein
MPLPKAALETSAMLITNYLTGVKSKKPCPLQPEANIKRSVAAQGAKFTFGKKKPRRHCVDTNLINHNRHGVLILPKLSDS